MYSLVPPVWCHLQTWWVVTDCRDWFICWHQYHNFCHLKYMLLFLPLIYYDEVVWSFSLTNRNMTWFNLTDRFLQLWGGILVDFLFNSCIQTSFFFFQNQRARVVNVWGTLWYADKTWLVCTSVSRVAVFLVCLDPLWDLSARCPQSGRAITRCR